MLRKQHIAWLSLIWFGSSACAAARPSTGPESPAPLSVQEEVRWAAIAGALEEARPHRPDVDPRPLDLTHHRPADAAYREMDARQLERLVARLRARGVDTTTAFPITGCDALLLPPETKDVSGCPSEPQGVDVFDIPEQIGPSEWRVRMASVGLNPTGSLVYVYEISIGERDGRPVFTGMKLLYRFE